MLSAISKTFYAMLLFWVAWSILIWAMSSVLLYILLFCIVSAVGYVVLMNVFTWFSRTPMSPSGGTTPYINPEFVLTCFYSFENDQIIMLFIYVY